MAITRPLAAALLVGVLVTAHFALVKQAEWNGTFNLDSLMTYTNRVLPNTDIPIRIPAAGIEVVDNYFAFMISFFWATLDARNVRAHWQGNHLLGTLTSIWMVMVLEAHRGKGGTFVFLTYFLEVMGEFLGIGLFTPIWCLVHLGLTTAPKGKLPAISKGSLRALGWGLLVGHVVPTVLMLRTGPAGEGVASQQIWTVARLFHPMFLVGFWGVFSGFQGKSGSASASGARRMYTFSMLASGFFHVTSLGFLLAAEMFPGWVKEDVTSALDPKTVLLPVPFWSEDVIAKVDFETGVAVFLQWDYLCSSAAIVIWAAALYAEAASARTVKASQGYLEMIGQTLMVAVLAGPGAAAAFLMQERDAILSMESGDEKKMQ